MSRSVCTRGGGGVRWGIAPRVPGPIYDGGWGVSGQTVSKPFFFFNILNQASSASEENFEEVC